MLQGSSDGGTFEERTKIPTAQAEALLQVSEGKIGYRRSQLRIGIEVDATLDRFEQPAGLDLVVLQFADQNEADGFSPLPWLGPEVTSEDRFSRRTLAVAGAPIEEAVEASNRSLIALVEMLDQSGGSRHLSAPALGASLQTSVAPASETQADHEAPSRRARLPVRLPEQVRFPRANDELVANAVVDARLPDVFEAMSRELSPAPVEASPNTMVAEEVEIKRSGRKSEGPATPCKVDQLTETIASEVQSAGPIFKARRTKSSPYAARSWCSSGTKLSISTPSSNKRTASA